MKIFDILDIKHLSSNDKGQTFELENFKSAGLLLAHRKADSMSGNHWHEGKSSAKNPEHVLLIQGKMRCWARHLDSQKEKEEIINAPKLVKIYPRVLHKLYALEDSIFMEFNSLEEHKVDTYYSD